MHAHIYINVSLSDEGSFPEIALSGAYMLTSTLWNGPVHPFVRLSVRPFTIACERDVLKTACQIEFTF